ncbi:peptidyl-tRNA hydrolase, PTH2 family [Mycolicibacterium fluoranthenivorans]|uniref:peptidyl-tRNA hydrolase n=1 Tax=Mycolicibacterium fluoranthenivorans TaxID=258505 RepID=A0A1G4WBT2_9MYCO|nr:peptidyl-tRNA hydrolase, PTH2 family [Mycolicibacterium fluoranthenivorans]
MMGTVKQLIVMRTDLNMRKGKMVAQGAHAAVAAVVENLDDPRVVEWMNSHFTKICVGVGSADELSEVMARARAAGLITRGIVDSGRTEFGGVPTPTCAAIGPDTAERLDPVTGGLRLL